MIGLSENIKKHMFLFDITLTLSINVLVHDWLVRKY